MIEQASPWKNIQHLEPNASFVLQRYRKADSKTHAYLGDFGPEATKDPAFIEELITLFADPSSFDQTRFQQTSLSVILDYLKKTHKLYASTWLPKMEMAIASLRRSFDGHPLVDVLDHFYCNYQNELLEHIELEEKRLFPFAERLYDGRFDDSYSVEAFQNQHDHALEDGLGEVLMLIENDFPSLAQSFAFRSFMHLLSQFRLDLEVHHLIEERVFLQKVKNLQESLS